MSVGSRQTRRKRRARRRRAQLRKFAGTVTIGLVAVVHELGRGFEWKVLFFALLFSLAMAVTSALLGEGPFAVLFLLSSLFLYVALWTRESE